ncbi:MAG: class I SAM-dependent methyltransferase [Proteobacteria bacterium]|nr:class I SAM-dependent methyltransferase [Pseudomonadota bacterium]MBU1709847.1 class I SAM-dependent methyltransferase [Pseudomonadota bacterium]
MNDEFIKWADAYKKFQGDGSELLWPSETLIRLFKGSYIPGLAKYFSGKKLLDVGCGNGNNLIFLAGLGLDCSAIEVTQGICDDISRKFRVLGKDIDARCGTNVCIPFEENSFDFLVSWNVLHYENCEDGIEQALNEYVRVLKPGGRFFISTTGPEHKILKDSEPLGGHRFRIGREDDFRKGQVFYYFETEENIQRVFSRFFYQVQVGRTHDYLISDILDWFIVTGVKS